MIFAYRHKHIVFENGKAPLWEPAAKAGIVLMAEPL